MDVWGLIMGTRSFCLLDIENSPYVIEFLKNITTIKYIIITSVDRFINLLLLLDNTIAMYYYWINDCFMGEFGNAKNLAGVFCA